MSRLPCSADDVPDDDPDACISALFSFLPVICDTTPSLYTAACPCILRRDATVHARAAHVWQPPAGAFILPVQCYRAELTRTDDQRFGFSFEGDPHTGICFATRCRIRSSRLPGFRVFDVTAGGLAERAGLQRGHQVQPFDTQATLTGGRSCR